MLSLEDRWGRTPLLLATSNGNTEVEQNIIGISREHNTPGSKPPLGEGCFNQGLQQRQRNPASFLRPVLIFHLLLHKRRQVIPLSRYGHSKVLKLLEHHLENAGDIKGMDAADGRLHLKLRRT